MDSSGAGHSQVEFYTDSSVDEIRLLFMAVAECEQTDVLKLVSRAGRMMKLCPDLPANKPTSRYRLHVTAAVPATGAAAAAASNLGLVEIFGQTRYRYYSLKCNV